MKGRPLAIALALLCALAASAAGGATLYVQRTVVADPGALRLRDLVQVPGDLSAAAGETLDSAVATMAGTPLSVPARLYTGLIENAFGPDCILVGSRTLVVPRGQLADAAVQLLARLADFLGQQGLLGESRAELQVLQPLQAGLPPGAAPVFVVSRSVKAAGGSDVTCAVSTSASEPPVGSITLRVRTTGATAAEGVRAGDKVQVTFRRGLVAIEMQGKALATAGFGDSVAVSIPDGNRSFSGRVIGKKVVEVELP
jgi:hypothetical protein